MATGVSDDTPLCWRSEGGGHNGMAAGGQGGGSNSCRSVLHQLLLDLVKAFERVQHWVLVREAIALDYPLGSA